jgi:hypothetical protein
VSGDPGANREAGDRGEPGRRARPRFGIRTLRVRRLTRKVESLRAEIERCDDAEPIAQLELLYRLADETEKLDRLDS